MPENSHAGKNILVTGVGRMKGIGSAIAKAFANEGANLLLTSYSPYDHALLQEPDEPEIDIILQNLRSHQVKVFHLEIDLGEPEAAARVFDTAEDVLGPIDILVNNAVHDVPNDLAHLTPEQIDRHYEVNLRAPILLCREFFVRHDGRPGGRIINLTSGQGLGPMPDQLAYAATKGGLDALTISLAPVLAKKQITVNAVDPGPTDTGWMDGATYNAIRDDTPLGRVGLPGDAANLVRFLASEEGGWITGQVIRSRGGY